MNSMAKQMDMFEEGGLMDEGGTVDPVSGNDVPPGSTQEEVRDDIPAQLSEGEFVFPADVVRYFGLEKLMEMRQEAKMGLQRMEDMGQMGNSEEAIMPDNLPFSIEDLDTEDEDEYNTPQEFAYGGVVQLPGTNYTTTPNPGPTTGFRPYVAPSIPGYTPQPVQTGPQYQGVQLPGTNFIGATERTNIPTFGQTVGTNPGQYDEFRTYVNSSGQTLRIPFKNGQPLYPIPQGYTLQKEDAVKTESTVPTTTVGQYEDRGGDDNGYDDPTSGVSSGVVGKSSAYDKATKSLGITQLGILSPTMNIINSVLGNVSSNTKATMGNLARTTAMDILDIPSIDQATPSQLDAIAHAMTSAVNLSNNVKNSTPAEVSRAAATISGSLIGAYKDGTLSLDQLENIANVELDSTTGAWKDQKAVKDYVDAILSQEMKDIELGLIGTSKEKGITAAEKAARQSAEIEAEINAGTYGLDEDDPEDTGGPVGIGGGQTSTGAPGTGGLGPGGGGGSVSGGGTVGSAPGMGNTGTDTSGEDPSDGNSSGSNAGGGYGSNDDGMGGGSGGGGFGDGDSDSGSGADGGGTYICTASYANGIIPRDHFTSLKKYGIMLRRNDPYLMKAYDWFGPKLASVVKKGKLSGFAKHTTAMWNYNQTKQPDVSFGIKFMSKFHMGITRPVLRIVGLVLVTKEKLYK
jgi:hypothetical protein